jgi:hypothetical protein
MPNDDDTPLMMLIVAVCLMLNYLILIVGVNGAQLIARKGRNNSEERIPREV